MDLGMNLQDIVNQTLGTNESQQFHCWYTTQINENIGSHTNLYMNVQSSSVLNSQKETI